MLARPRSQLGKPIFYGWVVVAGAFGVTFVGFGCAYSFGAFLGSLQHDFNASRGSVSLVFSLAGALYFSLGLVTGPLADRIGSRRVAAAGMILIGLGLALASVAKTLPQVYAAYGLGVGFGIGCSYAPAVGAVQRWFVRRRGLASGIAVSGIGVGTLVVPQIATHLIAAAGWRGAYLALGVLAAIFGIAASLVIVNAPQERGTHPDGVEPAPLEAASETRASVPDAGAAIGEALRSRRFAGLYAAGIIVSFALFVPFVHLVPYAQDRGVAPQLAVLLLGAIGIGSTAGRFALGGIADRIGRKNAFLATFAGMAVTLALWPLAREFVSLAIFALAYGVFYGAYVAVLPALVMDYFGGRNVGGLIGILYTSAAFGTLFGPSLAGFAYDLHHDYTLPILASAATNILAAIVVALTSRGDPRSNGHGTPYLTREHGA